MSSRKRIVSGDLVLHNKVIFEAALVHRYGLVVGVRYPRTGEHIGCEERISVFFATQPHFDDVCDCELLQAHELP